MENKFKLSIINPDKLVDPGVKVDKNFRFEKEKLFDPNNVAWMFYGKPCEHIVKKNGIIETNYGYNYSWGHIESIFNPHEKYDIIFGLKVKRIDLDNSDFDSESDSESNVMPNKKRSKISA